MNRRDLVKCAVASVALPSFHASMAMPVSGTRADAETLRTSWPRDDDTIALALFRRPALGPAVVYVHGATYPASMSVAWRIDGVSWMDHLHAGQFDTWAFDFAGYGQSGRPAAFERPADESPPFGTYDAAAAQLILVLQGIRDRRPDTPIHVVAHSWGTLAAQLAAIQRPDLVSRLVLFGPVAPRHAATVEPRLPAWELITADFQRPRYRQGFPESEPTPVSNAEIERWCAAYLDTDPTSSQRSPRSVKVPNGAAADLGRLWSGESLVDSNLVRQPTLIIRGEWDHVCTDDDARVLYDALGARDKRDVKVSGGNHWLHLQPRRTALWSEVSAFLAESA